jgi:hypothetical protein
MLVSGVSSNVVQTSSSVSTGGVAPYCCSEPSCPCEGGRAAKAKLESQQLEQRSDAVSISPQAFERLASEAANPLSERLSIQAAAPVAEISASEFPENYQTSNVSASLSAYQGQERKRREALDAGTSPGQVINTFA